MYKLVYTIDGKSIVEKHFDWQYLLKRAKKLKKQNKHLQWCIYNQGGILLDSNLLSPDL